MVIPTIGSASQAVRAAAARSAQPTPAVVPTNEPVPPPLPVAQESQAEAELEEEILALEDMEHLQLTLQEAYFLSWGLGCLKIIDPDNVRTIVFEIDLKVI